MAGVVQSRTPNYGFAQIRFDAAGWQTAANQNWAVLDALLSTRGVSNIRGAWGNSATYLAGDQAVDTTENAVYRAIVDNTSPDTGTFAQFRAAHPGSWVKLYVPGDNTSVDALISTTEAMSTAQLRSLIRLLNASLPLTKVDAHRTAPLALSAGAATVVACNITDVDNLGEYNPIGTFVAGRNGMYSFVYNWGLFPVASASGYITIATYVDNAENRRWQQNFASTALIAGAETVLIDLNAGQTVSFVIVSEIGANISPERMHLSVRCLAER